MRLAEPLRGSGPPIVLLHGVLRSTAAWRGVAQRLHAAGRTVILAEDEDHARAPNDAAADLIALMGEGAHLVGHSRGGTVASWVAAERPELARSLVLIASPPDVSETFRAHFRALRKKADSAEDERTFDALSRLPEDAWPGLALRRYQGRALVIEAEDDPLYSPRHTLFWRTYLPYADFERVPGGHEFFTESAEQEAWLAERLLRHVRDAELPDQRGHDRSTL
ncbi:MAG: alpha/beta fold hydrolase [Candidatus Thermoplasmatota archaeon]